MHVHSCDFVAIKNTFYFVLHSEHLPQRLLPTCETREHTHRWANLRHHVAAYGAAVAAAALSVPVRYEKCVLRYVFSCCCEMLVLLRMTLENVIIVVAF